MFGQRRVGHSGTLDPDATGVLLVGLGRVTRLLRWLTDLPKTYTGEVVLGVATSTLDAAGEVVGEWDMTSVALDDVRSVVAAGFVGEVSQVPPMVSAVKVGGRRLHELARAGVEVERAARQVTVYRFDVVRQVGEARPTAGKVSPRVFAIEVECSSGTYVRTLAADLGTALGGGAHLRALRRTAIGSFSVGEAVPLESVGAEHVLSPVDALRDYPMATVDEAAAVDVSHGKRLAGLPGGVVRVVSEGGELLAVYDDGKPSAVLAAS